MNAALLDAPRPTRIAANAQVARSVGIHWGFVGLLALTALLRLPAIDRPLVGVFATKNAVYAMIARNAALGRAPLWRPTIDCLAGGERAWHLVEFPVSAYVTGGLWRSFGGSLDVWGRLTAVAFSVASVGLLLRLVRKWHGPAAGWGAAIALAVSPVSIIYGQSFMLEASVVFFTLATVDCVERWLEGRRTRWLLLGAVCLALLLLTKIYMLVMLLPLSWMVWRRRGGLSWPTIAAALGLGTLAAAAAIAWYADAYRTATGPQADRVYFSVKRSATDHAFPHPILRRTDFYRQALDDLAGVALTPVGLMLSVAGLLHPHWRRHAPWLIAMGLLFVALPLKFHEMNYYYLVILPPLCVLVGLGWQLIVERLRPGRPAVAAILLLALVFALRFAARPAFATPAEDRSVVAAARAARGLLAADESIVTMHGSTIDLLYYCDRPGWAIAPDHSGLAATLAQCRRRGARYLVIADLGSLPASVPNAELLAALPSERTSSDWRIVRLR
jgi:hypothetical protein